MYNNEYPYGIDGIYNHSRRPYYNDESDYNTNSPSYYDDLARKQRLFKYLAEKVGMYDKELEKRFKEWDLLISKFPENVENLLIEWMEDGTLDKIINENIFNMKADKEDVEKVLNIITQSLIYANQQQYPDLKSRLDASDFVLNLKSYGCKGDGKTDETKLIQKALNEYDTIFIPNGTYILSGVNMLKVRSGMTLLFESKNAVFKVSENQGDWQSMLYTDGYSKNINVIGGTLDCNNKNTDLTDTNGWINKGRILIKFELGEFINVYDMKFITNGFWGIRGKWKYGHIMNNDFMFDLSVPALKDFDVSTIWLGGKHNMIERNRFESQVKSDERMDYQGRTAVEFQGHYNIVRNNFVRNYRAGVIITNSTSYENPELNIKEGGNESSVIEGNSFIDVQQGVKLWLMKTAFENPIMRNLRIIGNTITLKQYRNTQGTVGINIFRPLGSSYNNPAISGAEGKQNGSIHNLDIKFNNFSINNRKNEHCLDLTPTFEMKKIVISNNVIDNFGGFGIRTGEYQVFDDGVLVDPNNHFQSEISILDNVFRNVKSAVNLHRNVKDALIKGNEFTQTEVYPLGENTVELIKIEWGGKYKERDSIINYPPEIKPFIPKFKNKYYNYRYLDIADSDDKVVTKMKYVAGKTSDYQQLAYNHLLLDNGFLFETGSEMGDTFGALSNVFITGGKLNSGITPSYVDVNNGSKLNPHDTFRTDEVYTLINTFPVLAVEMNRVYLGYHPTFTSGNSFDTMIGKSIRYTANVQNINKE